jgi:hypothetical protein
MSDFRRRLDGVIVREVAGEILLLDTVSAQIHQLNSTAALVWRNCENARCVEWIAELLESEFDVKHDIAVKDVVDTLATLQALHLVVEVSPDALQNADAVSLPPSS